jgi:uncharacterized protein YegL
VTQEQEPVTEDLHLSKPRLPVILLVDTSASMNEDSKIDILNEKLARFKEEIRTDEFLHRTIEVSLLSFGNTITVLHEFSEVDNFNPPILEAKGPCLMGAGILKALALLEERKYFYKKNALDCSSPCIFLVGGSTPDDFQFRPLAKNILWNEIKGYIKESQRRKYHFFTCLVLSQEDDAKCIFKRGETIIKTDDREIIYEKGGEVRWIERETESMALIPLPHNMNWCEKHFGEEGRLDTIASPSTVLTSELDHDVRDEEAICLVSQSYTSTSGNSVRFEGKESSENTLGLLQLMNEIAPVGCSLISLRRIPGFKEVLSSHIIDEYQLRDSPELDKPINFEPPQRGGSINIIGASVIGPLHIMKGIPCQDAHGHDALPSGHLTFAIADGLGSAPMSEIGSRIAVEAAVDSIKNKTSEEMKTAPLSSLARDSILAGRKALEDKAVALQCSLRDLACTLISAVIYGDNLAVAHIGDGAVIVKKRGQLIVASEPGESEYANEVTPLTSTKWEESLRISPVYSDISGVMAFSDGLQRAALRKTDSGRIPYKGFCDPLFSFAEALKGLEDGERELKEFLASKKISEHSEDDKTLILVTLRNLNQETPQ